MWKSAFVIAMAFCGLTVGAGFASGQEILQFFVSYGVWGVAGAVLILLLMPLTAMTILQYGSYFRAQSHGVVFRNITSTVTAKVLDYGLTLSQFCIGFVMLAGAGSNLNQQFGLPLWFGAALMTALVIIAGLLDVERITNIIGFITPVMFLLLLVAGVYGILDAPDSIDAIHTFAVEEVPSPVTNWWLAALNYIGLCMFASLSMTMIIGGSNWNPVVAGRGGLLGGAIFGLTLTVLTVGLFSRVIVVAPADLPTLSLINEMNPHIGLFAALGTYAMIFSTAIGVFFSTGKRLAVARPDHFKLWFIGAVLVGFGLSFFEFKFLVNQVFPLLGWFGLAVVVILLGAWLLSGRKDIGVERRRRDHIRSLILRSIDPGERFSNRDYLELVRHVEESPVDNSDLRDDITADVVAELHGDDSVEFTEEHWDSDDHWQSERKKYGKK